MTGRQRKAEYYATANIECARLIAADPDRYPGLMQEWAAKVLNALAGRTATATRRAA